MVTNFAVRAKTSWNKPTIIDSVIGTVYRIITKCITKQLLLDIKQRNSEYVNKRKSDYDQLIRSINMLYQLVAKIS